MRSSGQIRHVPESRIPGSQGNELQADGCFGALHCAESGVGRLTGLETAGWSEWAHCYRDLTVVRSALGPVPDTMGLCRDGYNG